MYTEEILRKVWKARKEEAEQFFGDVICEAVDLALKNASCELRVEKGKIIVRVWHDLKDSESSHNPFLKFELEKHLFSFFKIDGEAHAHYEKEDLLEIADSLEALAKRIKTYEWDEE